MRDVRRRSIAELDREIVETRRRANAQIPVILPLCDEAPADFVDELMRDIDLAMEKIRSEVDGMYSSD